MLQIDRKSTINETGPRLLETCATPDLKPTCERGATMANPANIMIPSDCSSENKARLCARSFEHIAADLWNMLDENQIKEVMSGTASAEIDREFPGFVDVYEALSSIIPEHFHVVDLGCAYAPQSMYFEGHRSYIGVDTYDGIRFSGRNSVHRIETIQDYILHLKDNPIDGPAFAICSYVPNWHGLDKKIISQAFEDLFIFYPKRGVKV